MVIEVDPGQLYTLAGVLQAGADRAAQSAGALAGAAVEGPLAAAVAGFCESTRTAGACLAGELSWLSGAVAAAADSWLQLDGSLRPTAAGVLAR
jgi:hypothetical protein